MNHEAYLLNGQFEQFFEFYLCFHSALRVSPNVRTICCTLGVPMPMVNWGTEARCRKVEKLDAVGKSSCIRKGNINTRWWFQTFLGFYPYLGKVIRLDEHIFQMGW